MLGSGTACRLSAVRGIDPGGQHVEGEAVRLAENLHRLRRCAGRNGLAGTDKVTNTRTRTSWNFTQRASTFKALSTPVAQRPLGTCRTTAKTITSWPYAYVRSNSIGDLTRGATSPSSSPSG